MLFTESNTLCEIKQILNSQTFTIEPFFITDRSEYRSARICICADNNTSALEALKDSQIPVITCGMNSRNTITLSSYTETSCSLTLRRSIECINGKIIEPAEYPIKTAMPYHPYTIMAVTAIALLNGKFPISF